MMLTIVAYYDYEIWKMDVKIAFLNEFHEEEIYMEQLSEFESIDPWQVCWLKRSIYGLKQAWRSWTIRFDHEIKGFGFLRNPDESCVYKKANGSNIVFLVFMWMIF